MVNMKKAIANILLLCLFSTVLLSCRKEDEEFIGPTLAAATSNFTLTTGFTATPDPVDFSTEVVKFHAEFNETVTWTITITGSSSGAEFVMNGTANQLDSSIVQWDGSTSNQILFRNEACTAVLTVLAGEQSWSAPILINVRKEYGTLWSDFETPLPPTWYPASVDPGDAMTATIQSFQTPDGTSVLALEGNDVNASYYIGNVGENRQSLGTPFNTGTTDPSQLYFNVFIYGFGSGNKAKLEFQFTEDDDGNGFPGWGVEDNYILTFEAEALAYDGWKLHSVKYSSITNQYSVGNQIQQPDKILALGILLSSVPQGNMVSAKIDYPVFTIGEPLFGFQ